MSLPSPAPLLLLLLGLAGCNPEGASSTAGGGAELTTVAPPADGGMVALTSAAGVKIEPPAKKEQIPDGAWYCDMGTVHFAATEAGDGKCDLCGMKLVHKEAR